MTNSCLVSKLSHFVELSAFESQLLATFEEATEHHRRRDVVLERGAPMENIYVLRSGWLYGHISGADGSELVADIFYPGDMVGIGQLAITSATLTYTAATDISLCPFPKRALGALFDDHPRLVALLFAFAALERATMLDRLRAATVMSARDCLALFLLQTKARLAITHSGLGNRFDLPLTQEMIGNAVGLSTVSVNRAIRLLERQNRIRREGRAFELVDPDRLAREVEFQNRYYKIDVTWMPGLPGAPR